MLKRKYSTGYADYPGVGRITDEMIAQVCSTAYPLVGQTRLP